MTDIDHQEDEKYIVKAYSCLDEETKHLSMISLTQIKLCNLKDFTNYEMKKKNEEFDILKIRWIEEFSATRCHIRILIRVAYCRMNGLDGRGGVDGFSMTYDGPLPVTSEECSRMHDTGIWESCLGQQKCTCKNYPSRK